jgi:hypothetical protein
MTTVQETQKHFLKVVHHESHGGVTNGKFRRGFGEIVEP